mgnify:CR=1 FL=1
MTKNEVKMLLDYGFSVSEIVEMEKTPAPAPDPAPAPALDPAPAPALDPAPAPNDISNRDLLAAVTRLTNMMALSNIRNNPIINPEPDVTAQLNSLFAAPPTQK